MSLFHAFELLESPNHSQTTVSPVLYVTIFRSNESVELSIAANLPTSDNNHTVTWLTVTVDSNSNIWKLEHRHHRQHRL
jgi:hypothetical protein